MFNFVKPKSHIETIQREWGWATPEARLQGFCKVLNERKDWADGQELAALLREWMAAPSLKAVLSTQEWGWVWSALTDGAQRPIFAPSDKGMRGEYLTAPPGPDDKIPGGVGFAFTVWMFGTLVTNPICEKLGGPCARCGNYYIKKRASQKVYCSRRCGNAATAVARTAERDAAERKEKLLRAKAAIREWRSAKPQQDWKPWIAQKTGIDLRFLTRAVKKGDLVPPKRGK